MNTETAWALQTAAVTVTIVVVLYAGVWTICFRPTVLGLLAAIIAVETTPVMRA